MALAEMQKVRVACHEYVLGDLMPKIQDLGCCHFVSQAEQDGRHRSDDHQRGALDLRAILDEGDKERPFGVGGDCHGVTCLPCRWR